MTFDRITHDSRGKACIRDTGITVAWILGAMAGGSTRRELLEKHHALESADIDEAFAFIKEQVRARELPDMEFRGKELTAPEISDFRAPAPVGDRVELLIHQEKTTGVTSEETEVIEDDLRLDHLVSMMKAVAKIHMMATAG